MHVCGEISDCTGMYTMSFRVVTHIVLVCSMALGMLETPMNDDV